MRLGHLVAAMIVWLPTGFASAEGPVIEQRAIDLARASAEFLATRPAMSFDWFVSYDEVVNGREKLTFMRSGTNLLIRDKGFFSSAENERGLREYYFDGATVTVAAPLEGFYASGPFDGTFEELVDAMQEDTGSDLPLFGLMSRNLPEGIADGLDGAAYLGITRVAGREVHHLAFSDYEEDWQVWISTDDEEPVPVAIIGTNPYSQGWPQYRAYLTRWDFNPKPDENAFVYEPSADDEKLSFPALKARSEAEAETGAPGAPSVSAEDSPPSGAGAAPPATPN